MGFGADIVSRKERDIGKLLSQASYQDLLQFGFIPEFVGRLPVVTTLDRLGEKELVKILVEPRNAIIKQYKKFFEMEGVELTFTPDALKTIARRAMEMETGARGLRAILESVMLDIMYDLPSRSADVSEVRVDSDVIESKKEPHYVAREKKESA
jgi:ATP-dependent Clp protease ATP-binding subunit ClpX